MAIEELQPAAQEIDRSPGNPRRAIATDLTFDETLAALLGMVGQRVEVHAFDAGETPHLVATFGGTLRAGYSLSGGDPSEQEAIFVRLGAGAEQAAISLDRELYGGGIAHPDGALTVRLGAVELVIARRDDPRLRE